MPKGKLPKGVQTIGEAMTRRGRGGQLLKEARIGMASRTAAASPRGQRMINKLGRGLAEKAKEVRKMERFQSFERATHGALSRSNRSFAQLRPNQNLQRQIRQAPKVSGRLAGLAKGLGAVAAPIAIYLGAKEWKKQGGPSATELLGIKKYKRRPKVKYGGQEM